MKQLFYFFLLCSVIVSAPNVRLNLYYDDSALYTKFSDWIPRQLHTYKPRFVEDFFLLHGLKQYYGEQELLRNVYFLKIALHKKFRHPSAALVKIKTPEEYHKYRLLMHMHIQLRIMRSYLRIGSQYDKRHLYFYNLDYAPELNESFKIAKYHYEKSIPHWEEAKNLALEASKYKFSLDLGQLESTRFRIKTGDLDFEKITSRHLDRLSQKQKMVSEHLAKYGYEKP